MSDFVLDQITQNAIQQAPVNIYDNVIFQVNHQLVLVFVHRRLVEVD
jgi:hypothetical protein